MHQGPPYVQYSIYPSQQPTIKPYPSMTAVSPETRNMLNLLESLFKPELREKAIFELAKHREKFQQLGLFLWYSVGTMAILLHEVISVYPLLHTPELLSKKTTSHVGSVLTLLQSVAYEDSTRKLFLDAHICLFLYPFLRGTSSGTGNVTEGLRLTSLGVIGALVKTDDADVMQYLLSTEIFPLCLKIMEYGLELSRTLATFVVQKLLLSDLGLQYVCQTPERFRAVATVLQNMVGSKDCTPRLLRYIIRCYLRLSENPRACDALSQCLPGVLRNDTYKQALESSPNIKKWLLQLLVNIGDEGARKIVEGNMNA
ncbi:cell differentiation protein [Trypanosoma rangeli]|uniref:Cell differentiation protein n=1 Tax=Trypanosoma rangeli TaxID=5698 RepID=A0A3R7N5E2_TRYRA|nr:cell differentiation protein [Trypanosoma rangeli]RNF00504.1 cell differentiation protein [Trypanosoma rangeli]|eukprot:RNF00504.1 cell differentiation protein [Trypanosoma rangeli]